MLRIYLPSSLDLPTIVTGFTYRRHRIYLPLSPDLPTVVTGFTYHHVGILYKEFSKILTLVSNLIF